MSLTTSHLAPNLSRQSSLLLRLCLLFYDSLALLAHTLTSPSSSNAFLLSSNVQTIRFAPYTPIQLLQEILQSQLTTLSQDENLATDVKKFLPNPTLMLLTLDEETRGTDWRRP
jgi:hypothetical protein